MMSQFEPKSPLPLAILIPLLLPALTGIILLFCGI